jgi:hypothetical protein
VPKGEDGQHPGSDGNKHRMILPAYGRWHGVKDLLAKQGRAWGPAWSTREGQGPCISGNREIGGWRQVWQIGS